jgi:hypothetical protein
MPARKPHFAKLDVLLLHSQALARIADGLGEKSIDRWSVAGRLCSLYTWCWDHAPDGFVEGPLRLAVENVETQLHWLGKRGKFARLLLVEDFLRAVPTAQGRGDEIGARLVSKLDADALQIARLNAAHGLHISGWFDHYGFALTGRIAATEKKRGQRDQEKVIVAESFEKAIARPRGQRRGHDRGSPGDKAGDMGRDKAGEVPGDVPTPVTPDASQRLASEASVAAASPVAAVAVAAVQADPNSSVTTTTTSAAGLGTQGSESAKPSAELEGKPAEASPEMSPGTAAATAKRLPAPSKGSRLGFDPMTRSKGIVQPPMTPKLVELNGVERHDARQSDKHTVQVKKGKRSGYDAVVVEADAQADDLWPRMQAAARTAGKGAGMRPEDFSALVQRLLVEFEPDAVVGGYELALADNRPPPYGLSCKSVRTFLEHLSISYQRVEQAQAQLDLQRKHDAELAARQVELARYYQDMPAQPQPAPRPDCELCRRKHGGQDVAGTGVMLCWRCEEPAKVAFGCKKPTAEQLRAWVGEQRVRMPDEPF